MTADAAFWNKLAEKYSRQPVADPAAFERKNLLGYNQLVVDVQAVLDTLTPSRLEVQTRASAQYLLHIRPYRTSENVIEGAVISFTERVERSDPRPLPALWSSNH